MSGNIVARTTDSTDCGNSRNLPTLLSDNEDTKTTEEEDLTDFIYYNSTDQIYREYDPPESQHGPAYWKLGRPTLSRSWGRCIFYSFVLTVICGAAISVIAVFVLWLDLNLCLICFQFSWYKMPKNIQQIKLTSGVVKGMIIQCWPLLTMLPLFGWNLVKRVNLLPWTVSASSIDAMYRLLLNVYLIYARPWKSFPLNALFASTVTFSCYRVACHFRPNMKQRIRLAAILGSQFCMGLPVTIIMNSVITPHYQHMSNSSRAILASLCPALLIIPKVVARICAKKTKGLNHPGTSVLLVITLHASSSMLFRILQARMERFSTYFILCFVHGFESTFDKITLPVQDYILQWCFKRCSRKTHRCVSRQTTPRSNRLLADLAILSITAEASAIFVSEAGIQILRYYYARNDKGERYDVATLLENFCLYSSIAIFIEFLFNTLAIKIQTYFYNIPIIRVWKNRSVWILSMSLIHTVMGLLVHGCYFYSATRSEDIFDRNVTRHCSGPFIRP